MNKLASERVVVSSPLSMTGSVKRSANWIGGAWRKGGAGYAVALVLVPVLLVYVALALAWTLIAVVLFGLLTVPWRLFRRGSRKDKAAKLRHREQLDVLAQRSDPPLSS